MKTLIISLILCFITSFSFSQNIFSSTSKIYYYTKGDQVIVDTNTEFSITECCINLKHTLGEFNYSISCYLENKNEKIIYTYNNGYFILRKDEEDNIFEVEHTSLENKENDILKTVYNNLWN